MQQGGRRAISILAHRNRAPNSPGIVLEMNGRDVFCISKKAASFSWKEDVRYNLGVEKIALNDFFKQSARFFPTFLLRAKILQHFFFLLFPTQLLTFQLHAFLLLLALFILMAVFHLLTSLWLEQPF